MTDPYSFGPVLGPMDDYSSPKGTHLRLFDKLGAHRDRASRASTACISRSGRPMPGASRWSAISTTGTAAATRCATALDTGIWEIFIPDVGAGHGLQVRDHRAGRHAAAAEGRSVRLRSPSCGPTTASVVADPPPFMTGATQAHRAHWARSRSAAHADLDLRGACSAPGARADGSFLTWDELAERLIPYVADMGFTHIEFLPITEHPFDPSWGYQPTGLYAPTARFGDAAGLCPLRRRRPPRRPRRHPRLGAGAFPDRRAWPGALRRHRALRACRSAPGLPSRLEHRDLQFRPHARSSSFLVNNALSGSSNSMSTACASMPSPRCSISTIRASRGEWMPNEYGGNENLEAVAFLQRDEHARSIGAHPGALTIAEESTSWPRRLGAGPCRRARLRLQVEHGVHARHAALHGARPDPPRAPPQRHDLRPALRLHREFRAAAQP